MPWIDPTTPQEVVDATVYAIKAAPTVAYAALAVFAWKYAGLATLAALGDFMVHLAEAWAIFLGSFRK